MISGYDNLAQNIKFLRNSILNDLTTRKYHPSYGITKVRLRSEYERLVGMLYAIYLIDGGQSVNIISAASAQANLMGINLQDIKAAIKAS